MFVQQASMFFVHRNSSPHLSFSLRRASSVIRQLCNMTVSWIEDRLLDPSDVPPFLPQPSGPKFGNKIGLQIG
jgi:hypothetical protein